MLPTDPVVSNEPKEGLAAAPAPLFAEVPVTLEALLRSREERVARQRHWLRTCPHETLLCLTVVFPGPVKRTRASLRVGEAALSALSLPGVRCVETRDLPTGFEAYLLTDRSPLEAKRRCVAIEEDHPWGRLFDIDVIGPDGIPLSRDVAGAPPRRCLLCGNPARFCMRNHTHTTAQLLAEIHRRIKIQENS